MGASDLETLQIQNEQEINASDGTNENSSTVDPTLVDDIYAEAKQRVETRRHVPSATYRAQFNKLFTFKQAREQVRYLHDLGISDLYASPYFKAAPESLHGYDIANHNELNPSIGTEDELAALVDELHRHGMSQILDTVPNHMGIAETGNLWWRDVLENGRSSVYSPYFDIDWDPINTKLTNKVLLPVLGGQYGTVLENGELKIEFVPEEGRFTLCYWDKSFPLEPRSYATMLEVNRERLVADLGPENDAALEYQSIITAINHLPEHSTEDRAQAQERNREKEVVKRRLAALCASEPKVREAIDDALKTINGAVGDPHSFDLLDTVLEGQPYRLSYWRVATEEINYRRFFDVNELAAVRVDRPEVFEETHRMILRFLLEGKLDGLRLDHVDGLYDPAGYFADLQRAYFREMCRAVMDDRGLTTGNRSAIEEALLRRFEEERTADPKSVLNRPLYVVVEKILARGEALPADWLVDGTTGYEFTNAANGLFVDTENAKAFDDIYEDVTHERVKYADLVYESKGAIMRQSLSSEITILTNMLNRITQNDRHSRDFTVSTIRNAIRELIACFPVYRTYITPRHTEPDKRDAQIVETATSRAKRRNPATDPSIFDFLRDILLLRGLDGLAPEQREARLNFVMKFQQVTGPVTAKGIEDTSFYIYNRLISLNEVGGEPEYFGISPTQFHRAQAERQRNWPNSIVTTSTHDTKRSEDVRMRIDVLSEMPKEWRAAVRRWMRANRRLKKNVEGTPAPSPNEEYFLYQTLVGVWPFGDDLGRQERKELIERVQAYMRKALSEAKVNTSWVNPNEAYQQTVAAFVEAIMTPGERNRFLPDFLEFRKAAAHYGAFNSLSQVLLKTTGPGVPDIYQGTELWDLSLVDPDNRRPVDYALRSKLLKQVDRVKSADAARELLAQKEDGRIKLLVTSRALRFRRDNRALFEQGAYTPIEVAGKHAANIIAYTRSHEGQMAVAVAPCLMSRLGAPNKPGQLVEPIGEVWAESFLPIPGAQAGQRFRNIFTGEVLEAIALDGAIGVPLDEALRNFPVALLTSG